MASDVERIKEKLPIEEVIGDYVKLDKSSGRLKGRCPFHSEKTPSFFVSPERGNYYCFGCGAKGDIFTFIQEFERVDFSGALKFLAEKAGIELTFSAKDKKDEKDLLYEILEKATLFYQKELAQNKDVIAYLTNRGLSIATIKKWRLGYAPNDWKSLSEALISKGIKTFDMERVGLVKKSEKNTGEFYDRFRSRVMFPLFDISGRVVGFSGRIYGDDKDSAKYLNSPETMLFDKSSYLYGLDKAKTDIRKKNEAIIVEGQMDLLMSHQSGFTNTVAVSGTALTSNHIDTLKRFADTVVLAFDSDSAGVRANERSLAIALSKDMDIKVAMLKGSKDPADLIKENVESWRSIVEKPLHVIDYELSQSLEQKDQRQMLKKVESTVLPYVAVLSSPLQRGHFLSKISMSTGISEKVLQQSMDSIVVNKINKTEDSDQGIKNNNTVNNRIDFVLRQIAVAFVWIRDNKQDANYEKNITDYIKENADGSVLEEIESVIKKNKEALFYEAEAMFHNSENFKKEIDQILNSFLEEYIKKKLSEAMFRLKKAEGSGNKKEVEGFLRECHELSNRLHKLKNNL